MCRQLYSLVTCTCGLKFHVVSLYYIFPLFFVPQKKFMPSTPPVEPVLSAVVPMLFTVVCTLYTMTTHNQDELQIDQHTNHQSFFSSQISRLFLNGFSFMSALLTTLSALLTTFPLDRVGAGGGASMNDAVLLLGTFATFTR